MKKITANYSNTNHNFVIQNLEGQRVDSGYLSVICILKNILQRGCPTLLSKYLQNEIGAIHKAKDFNNALPLIDNSLQKWDRIIRGDTKGNYYPAKEFYETLVPKYLPNYAYIQQLLIPEVPINKITQVEVDEYANQQVDFYLPQAYLIIEIDGIQHEDTLKKDFRRDKHTAKYGIKTVRIKTADLREGNDKFKSAIKEIENRLDTVFNRQSERREKDTTFISLNEYKTALESGINLSNPNYLATAIIRFQILILELLELGKLNFDRDWNFEIREHDISEFAELAIKDVFIWLKNLCQLQKLDWEDPSFRIELINPDHLFTENADTVKVDFSLLKRYTDEFQVNPGIIFIRTDYLDEYRYFKNANGINPVFSSFEPYDYYSISTATPIKYQLKFGGKDTDERPLLFLLENIFLQEIPNLNFFEGQLPIIANALARNDTIGLLPTGSGKSVCYQLAAILQPAISFVVCPIKSLMYDQKADLDLSSITRVNHITSDDDGEDKERIQKEFGQGKYLFIFISPERFQINTFRQYFSSVNNRFNIAYAVIDEVHCLSEWGHDFRTSYLNLSNTINKLCSDFNFIGLTATASVNVLKDIQIEFGIKQENIKTPVDYTRKELEFEIIDDENNKLNRIKELISHLQEDYEVLSPSGKDSKCGIIFTPTVNGQKGCYQLSLSLSEYFSTNVWYYSGQIPKTDGNPVMTQKEFDEYKKEIQYKYRNNEFTFLAATKAFGMGVNKPNIHYTIHYGIPGSMEALYQEGGRAGRDKEKFKTDKAKCYVLLSKSQVSQNTLNQCWIRETPLSRLNQIRNQIDGDLNTNLFLFSIGLDVVKTEFSVVKKLHETYSQQGETSIVVEGNMIGANKAKTEKAIYRLSQLGIIEDWTVDDFFGGGVFKVNYHNYSDESIRTSLLNTINKYDPDFTFEKISHEPRYAVYSRILNDAPQEYSDFDKNILILLQWSYDNFAYNRRQSLKNIYENCCDFSEGTISREEFKLRLENYFKFNQSSFVLQHIAENPRDFNRWFEVFYKVEENLVTDAFISKREQEALRDNLSRFLESYMYNTGLDFISGMLRLWLDDYENVDGRNRFESSLKEIKEFNKKDVSTILDHILKIGKNFNAKNKSNLAESLYKILDIENILVKIQKELGDDYSMTTILQLYNSRLQIINKKIYGGLRKTG